MNLDSVACARCENGFEPKAKIVNSNGTLYCHGCFVCAQCFRPFQDNVFFEFEDRKYCEHCFHVLYAPCCGKCGEFIIGRVIKVRSPHLLRWNNGQHCAGHVTLSPGDMGPRHS